MIAPRSEGLRIQANRKQKPSDDTNNSPWRGCEGSGERPSSRTGQRPQFRKRALTPPYIPEKGLHQTWPGFGFGNVSNEGARASRKRTKTEALR